MSIGEIERFVADLKSDEALRAEVGKAVADGAHAVPIDCVVAFAASKGYAFTADEAKEHIKARARAAGEKLSDAELDGVAAGALDNGTSSLIHDVISGTVFTGTEFIENTGIVAPPWLPPSWDKH